MVAAAAVNGGEAKVHVAAAGEFAAHVADDRAPLFQEYRHSLGLI